MEQEEWSAFTDGYEKEQVGALITNERRCSLLIPRHHRTIEIGGMSLLLETHQKTNEIFSYRSTC